jgi:hypothetical protein
MYMGCCENNHVHPYKFFWVGESLYRLTLGDLIRLYRWSVAYFWVGEISRNIVEVWFSILYGYWRIRLSSYFGYIVSVERKRFSINLVILYWLGGLVFPLEFLKLTRLKKRNIVSLMC